MGGRPLTYCQADWAAPVTDDTADCCSVEVDLEELVLLVAGVVVLAACAALAEEALREWDGEAAAELKPERSYTATAQRTHGTGALSVAYFGLCMERSNHHSHSHCNTANAHGLQNITTRRPAALPVILYDSQQVSLHPATALGAYGSFPWLRLHRAITGRLRVGGRSDIGRHCTARHGGAG